MARSQQDLNWSSYQDKQLSVLREMEKSFTSGLNTSKLIKDSLTLTKNSIESIAKSLDVVARAMNVFAGGNFSANINNANNAMRNFSANTEKVLFIQDRYNGVIEHSIRSISDEADMRERNALKEQEEAHRRLQEAEEQRKAAAKARAEEEERRSNLLGAFDKVADIFSKVGTEANNYSTISNSLITATGASGASVRSFKNELVNDIVSDLNIATGGYYNAQDVYKQMTAIASSTGVDNLETLKEITRPIMLAQESIDVNINDMSTLLGKWSTRYTFSSIAMEELVDDIRGYTAGNNASAEASLKNISAIENWMNYYAQGDSSKISEMSESITVGTSWLESMMVDTDRYTEYISSLLDGSAFTDKSFNALLGYSGYDINNAYAMATSGQFKELYQLLFNAESNLFSGTMNDQAVKAQIASAYGLNIDDLLDAYNARYNNDNYVGLEDFIPTKSTDTAAGTVEDKYVSAAGKITNTWLEKIYNFLANGQEFFGIGLSDLAGGYVLFKSVLGGLSTLGKLTGVSKASLSASAATGGTLNSTVLGNLASTGGGGLAGAALTSGGILAGAGLALDGFSDYYNKDNDTATRAYSGAEAIFGTVAAGGLIASAAGLTAAGPVGWVALAAGAAAFAAKKIHEAVTPVSGAAEALESKFDELGDSLQDENLSRITQLESLKESIKSTDNFEEALQIANNSGLLNFKDQTFNSSEELIRFIEKAQKATSSLNDLNSASLDAAKSILAKKAAEEDKRVEEDIYNEISGMMTEGRGFLGLSKSLKKGEEGYAQAQTLFYQLANTITDETARNKALADIDNIFKDEELTDSELKFLTDTGGSLLAFDSFELDRKDNLFRQDRGTDYTTTNGILSSVGIEGYTVGETMSTVNDLISLYNSWFTATQTGDDDAKEKYASEFKDKFKTLSDDEKASLSGYAHNIGITGYATGSNYITSDQLAYLHEGEAVIPKRYNPMANLSELESLREQAQLRESGESQKIQEYIKDTSTILTEIKDFLSDWKADNIKREEANNRKNKFSYSSRYTTSYLQST